MATDFGVLTPAQKRVWSAAVWKGGRDFSSGVIMRWWEGLTLKQKRAETRLMNRAMGADAHFTQRRVYLLKRATGN